jgi:hypothetical protein
VVGAEIPLPLTLQRTRAPMGSTFPRWTTRRKLGQTQGKRNHRHHRRRRSSQSMKETCEVIRPMCGVRCILFGGRCD